MLKCKPCQNEFYQKQIKFFKCLSCLENKFFICNDCVDIIILKGGYICNYCKEVYDPKFWSEVFWDKQNYEQYINIHMQGGRAQQSMHQQNYLQQYQDRIIGQKQIQQNCELKCIQSNYSDNKQNLINFQNNQTPIKNSQTNTFPQQQKQINYNQLQQSLQKNHYEQQNIQSFEPNIYQTPPKKNNIEQKFNSDQQDLQQNQQQQIDGRNFQQYQNDMQLNFQNMNITNINMSLEESRLDQTFGLQDQDYQQQNQYMNNQYMNNQQQMNHQQSQFNYQFGKVNKLENKFQQKTIQGQFTPQKGMDYQNIDNSFFNSNANFD